MEEKYSQILQGALETFMSLGIKSVTMDDIASRLGVSKKTLYKYVSDKEDLIMKSLQVHHDSECSFIEKMKEQNLNAIDENFEISRNIIAQIQNIHPSVMFDMDKYYPRAKKMFEDYKQEVVYKWVQDNLERGIKEGLYRDDMNVQIIAGLYVTRMDDLFNPHYFPSTEFAFKDVYLESFRYHLRGIASDKGLKYWKEKMKEFNI